MTRSQLLGVTRRMIADAVPCPKCKAEKGQLCKCGNAKHPYVHIARKELYLHTKGTTGDNL